MTDQSANNSQAAQEDVTTDGAETPDALMLKRLLKGLKKSDTPTPGADQQ